MYVEFFIYLLIKILIQMRQTYSGIWTPASIALIIITALCAILYYSFDGEYLRLHAESATHEHHYDSI